MHFEMSKKWDHQLEKELMETFSMLINDSTTRLQLHEVLLQNKVERTKIMNDLQNTVWQIWMGKSPNEEGLTSPKCQVEEL